MTSADSRPLALWAAPRTVSTAFDKMMRTRNDHIVLTEPFSIPFYFGPERQSQRFDLKFEESTFSHTLSEVLRPRSKRVFLKDMPYQLGPLLNIQTLRKFQSSFLIRDPSRSIPSLLRMWEDASTVEEGYTSLYEAWMALRNNGESPPVLDSDDIRSDPAGVIAAWCNFVDIERRDDALNWEPGMPKDWLPWGPWFERAALSTGFLPLENGPAPAISESVAKRIDSARPIYNAMAAERIFAQA